MIFQNKHRGAIIPMVTPFTQDLGLDVAACERMVDRLATHGLGVFVMGTTGESASIPVSMRNRIVEIARKVANDRVPVYAGIGDNCVLSSIESARQYLALGVDAVVAHLPAYYTLDASEMLDYFKLIASQVDGPLVPYNMPQATHMSIPVETVARLADLPNVVGFKDSENQPGRLEAIAKLGGRPDFSIFMGVARHSIQALKHGYDGLVPSSGNLVPALWSEFLSLFAQGKLDEATELQIRLDQIATIFQKNCSLGQSLAALKSCMAAIGLCQNFVLPPLRSLPAEKTTWFRAMLEEFDIAVAPSQTSS